MQCSYRRDLARGYLTQYLMVWSYPVPFVDLKHEIFSHMLHVRKSFFLLIWNRNTAFSKTGQTETLLSLLTGGQFKSILRPPDGTVVYALIQVSGRILRSRLGRVRDPIRHKGTRTSASTVLTEKLNIFYVSKFRQMGKHNYESLYYHPGGGDIFFN